MAARRGLRDIVINHPYLLVFLCFCRIPTGNTYGKYVAIMAKLPSYLERQWNAFHVTLKIPKDVQPFFRQTKFWIGSVSTPSHDMRKKAYSL